jgi:hypothetical protein
LSRVNVSTCAEGASIVGGSLLSELRDVSESGERSAWQAAIPCSIARS